MPCSLAELSFHWLLHCRLVIPDSWRYDWNQMSPAVPWYYWQWQIRCLQLYRDTTDNDKSDVSSCTVVLLTMTNQSSPAVPWYYIVLVVLLKSVDSSWIVVLLKSVASSWIVVLLQSVASSWIVVLLKSVASSWIVVLLKSAASSWIVVLLQSVVSSWTA